MRKIHPTQASIYALYKPGSVCPCEWHFRSWGEIASHWQAGHFDTETDEPMTATEATREVADIHNLIRTLRVGSNNKRNTVNDTFDSLIKSLLDIEGRLSAFAAEVGKIKTSGS